MFTPLPSRIYAAVFVLSAGVLMLQIALNRVFSFTIWHHFAYMSISLALLGFGASGAMLAAFPGLRGRSLGGAVALYCAIAAGSTGLMLVLIGSLPLQPHRIFEQAGELTKLGVYFTVISVPFFFVGLAIALALRAAGPAVNRLYLWDLIGAGAGCALAVFCIDLLGPPRVVLLVALLFALAGIAAAGRSSRALQAANLGVAALLLLAMGPIPSALPFEPAGDKPVGVFFRKGVRHESTWSAVFRTDVVGWSDAGPPPGSFHALGVSSRYTGPIPEYRFITHDGGAGAVLYRTPPGTPALEMFRHQVLATPYVALDRPEVLVIGVGGGLDVVTAVANGARRVTGVELDARTVDLVRETYRDYTGGLYDREDVVLRASEGRHFARSTDQRFDLVQLTGVDTFAALSSVSYVTAEAYLYTVEAYRDFFGILRDGGILSIGTYDRPDNLRHTRRFVALSYAALRQRGVERPADHVAVVAHSGRGINAVEILTQLQPFSPEQLAALERFAAEEGFEAWYLPGRSAGRNPAVREILERGSSTRDPVFASAFYEVRPPSDDWPFFFSFYKWRNLPEAQSGLAGRSLLALGLFMWLVMLASAILIAGVTIGLPMLRVRGEAAAMPSRMGFLLYFAALGVGFIFIEISFVQRFILFLGYPTYSLTVTLFAFLTAAGLGAYLSGRLGGEPSRVLPGLTGALTAVVAAYVIALPWIFESLLSEPLAARVAVTALLCLPLGGLLGMFFPYGVRLTASINPEFVAWAWAANGCLTVVGSIASIILAMTYGFTAVIVAAVLVYWVGAASFVRSWQRAGAVA